MPDSHMYVELFRCCAASPTPELLRAAAAASGQITARWEVARAANRCNAAYEECALCDWAMLGLCHVSGCLK